MKCPPEFGWSPFYCNLIDDYPLNPAEHRLFNRITRRAGEGGVCFESIPSMARYCQISEKKVKSSLRILEAAGMVSRIDRPGYSTQFRIQHPKIWIEPEEFAQKYARPLSTGSKNDPSQNQLGSELNGEQKRPQTGGKFAGGVGAKTTPEDNPNKDNPNENIHTHTTPPTPRGVCVEKFENQADLVNQVEEISVPSIHQAVESDLLVNQPGQVAKYGLVEPPNFLPTQTAQQDLPVNSQNSEEDKYFAAIAELGANFKSLRSLVRQYPQNLPNAIAAAKEKKATSQLRNPTAFLSQAIRFGWEPEDKAALPVPDHLSPSEMSREVWWKWARQQLPSEQFDQFFRGCPDLGGGYVLMLTNGRNIPFEQAKRLSLNDLMSLAQSQR